MGLMISILQDVPDEVFWVLWEENVHDILVTITVGILLTTLTFSVLLLRSNSTNSN